MKSTLSVKNSERVINVKYISLQFIYWMMNCAVYSFAALFLLYNRFENRQLGYVLAAANLISIILQPALSQQVIARLHISVRKTIIIISGGLLLPLIALLFVGKNILVMFLMYTLSAVLILTLQPFVNSIGFQYINSGYSINFGISRGAGSFSYAITSYILGVLLAKWTPNLLPWIMIILTLTFLLSVWLLPKIKSDKSSELSTDDRTTTSIVKLLQNYKFIGVLFLAFSFLFVFHTIISTSITQIVQSFHGGSQIIGTSLMIAGLCELPGMFAFSYLVKKKSSSFWLELSAFFFFVRSIVVMVAPNLLTIELSQFLQAVSFAIFIPASAYLVNGVLPKEDAVLGQTIITAAMTLGGVLSSIIGGYLLDLLNVKSLLVFGMICALVGFLLTVVGIHMIKEDE
ncbi:MFS transporter [Levilactobacillus acidifarinae]|uniref:Sugar permease n=1 Tax=Levilactobacillus acidifarinae DSM 19394 = JCM 15949 TaxID=1423715 RepID=A0A0R1LJ57_9LACO|nr:MFS transporter [Levilactobacillus acidifarinae]KRK95963.1 sugar permease [Levilactobacillus acidifarinae DSM 19394]GEO69268.1 hypothetical protein LAC03_11780 [Levilactobacillus acidifarinae]